MENTFIRYTETDEGHGSCLAETDTTATFGIPNRQGELAVAAADMVDWRKLADVVARFGLTERPDHYAQGTVVELPMARVDKSLRRRIMRALARTEK